MIASTKIDATRGRIADVCIERSLGMVCLQLETTEDTLRILGDRDTIRNLLDDWQQRLEETNHDRD